VESNVGITEFQFNITEDEIKDLFADSNNGGTPQTRQEDGPTCEVQDQLTQVGCNLLEPLRQKATQVQFVTPLSKHQMDLTLYT